MRWVDVTVRAQCMRKSVGVGFNRHTIMLRTLGFPGREVVVVYHIEAQVYQDSIQLQLDWTLSIKSQKQ